MVTTTCFWTLNTPSTTRTIKTSMLYVIRNIKNHSDMAKYEIYDCNDEVIGESNDLLEAQISAQNENAKFILDTENNEIITNF